MRNFFKHLTTKDRVTIRHAAMVLVASGHAGLAFLAYIGLLEFTVPSEFLFIELAADSGVWFWAHGLIALLIVASIHYDRIYRQVMSASAGFMFTWSFFNLLWGLSTINVAGVSLAGPVLGFVLAGGSYLMAISPLPHEEMCHHGRD